MFNIQKSCGIPTLSNLLRYSKPSNCIYIISVSVDTLDIHICGACRAEFHDVTAFLQHKQSTCPVLITAKSQTTCASNVIQQVGAFNPFYADWTLPFIALGWLVSAVGVKGLKLIQHIFQNIFNQQLQILDLFNILFFTPYCLKLKSFLVLTNMYYI